MGEKSRITVIPSMRRVWYLAYGDFPTAGIQVEDLAYATDRLVFYRWNGAAWEAITIHSSSGVAASIPTAADLPNGSIYAETDTKLTKQVQAGAWVSIIAALTKELFTPVLLGTYGSGSVTVVGDFVTVLLSTNHYAICHFFAPHDFTSIIEAVILVIPDDTKANANWDIYSDYCANGEAFNIHSESDTASIYDITQNEIFEVDISGILSSLAAGDYVAVRLTNTGGTASTAQVIGVKFRYA